MVKAILVYVLWFVLFAAGFFIHALLSSTRIKQATARADFFECKWEELAEITSARTDQAKGDT